MLVAIIFGLFLYEAVKLGREVIVVARELFHNVLAGSNGVPMYFSEHKRG